MRLIIGLCALAASGSAASAQVLDARRPALTPTASRSRVQGTDSLQLSRRQAIAEALARNAQLEIAREQTAQARARRVTAIAVPDPTLTAAIDQATGPLSFGNAGSRPVGLNLSIPFPDKFRLNNRIGNADIGASE